MTDAVQISKEKPMSNNIEIFNLESVYDEQISPLMQQIINICKEHKMPVVASFAFANTEEDGPACCTTALVFEGRAIKQYVEATRIIRNEPQCFGITVMSGSKGND